MIDTLIFDLDGTLLDTLEDLRDSTNIALCKSGYPERSLEEVKCFVGNGVKKLIERAVPVDTDSENIEDCLGVFKENYKKNMFNKTAPYNGILEILSILKEKGFKIAVVSNKFDAAVKDLCEKYFKDLVSIAIGQSENIPKKPSPESVFKAIEGLNSKAENTIYIGDSEVDCQTAKNAKIPCIAVTWGFRSKDVLQSNGADYIVDAPCDIIKIVKDL